MQRLAIFSKEFLVNVRSVFLQPHGLGQYGDLFLLLLQECLDFSFVSREPDSHFGYQALSFKQSGLHLCLELGHIGINQLLKLCLVARKVVRILSQGSMKQTILVAYVDELVLDERVHKFDARFDVTAHRHNLLSEVDHLLKAHLGSLRNLFHSMALDRLEEVGVLVSLHLIQHVEDILRHGLIFWSLILKPFRQVYVKIFKPNVFSTFTLLSSSEHCCYFL